jgi:aminoglycoside phosphotransferase (APT) family kinase protein
MSDPRLSASTVPGGSVPSIEGTEHRATARQTAGTDPAAAEGPAGIDAAGVDAWFAANIVGAAPPLTYRLIAGGRSNLTFGVTDTAAHHYVLRRPPTGHLLPTAHDMGREHRIISAVGPAGIPVPAALGYCADPAVTGAPFYVMDFVDGYILRAESDLEGVFGPAERRRLADNLVDTLAAIHAVDPDAVGLGELSRKEGYIARQLRRWYSQYQASRDEQGGPDVADIDLVHDRLAARIPTQGKAGIVHGDYRLDNTIVGPDGAVVAVLDWELCTLGDTMADLGQLLVYWTEAGESSALAHSATAAPGFPTRAELARRYAEVSGRSIETLDFYLAFAYWKLACILEGVYTRYVAGAMGRDGFDFGDYPEMIRTLAAQALAASDRLA